MDTNEEAGVTIKLVGVDDNKRRELAGEILMHELESLVETLKTEGNPSPIIEGAMLALSLFLDKQLVEQFDAEKWERFVAAHPGANRDYKVLRLQAQATLVKDLIEVTKATVKGIKDGSMDSLSVEGNESVRKAASAALDDMINRNRTLN